VSSQEYRTARAGLCYSYRVIEHPAPRFTPTLFVSGAFQTMDSWSRFARTFAPHTTVLLVDPPGMGGSDLLPADRGVDFLAQCLGQVLDECNLSRCSVVAASYGTPSAVLLAATRPQHIDRIVLAGTMRELPPHLRQRIAGTVELARRRDREGLARECVDGMLCHDPTKPIERRERASRILRAGIARMSDAELLKYAANTDRLLHHEPRDLSIAIAGPEALVFTGEHDVFTRPGDCREVASAFERAWFTTVRRADHLFHLQQPEAVVELIFRFVARTLGPSPTDHWHAVEALNAPPLPSGDVPAGATPGSRSCDPGRAGDAGRRVAVATPRYR